MQVYGTSLGYGNVLKRNLRGYPKRQFGCRTLPEKVKIIDNTGKTLFESTVATKESRKASDGLTPFLALQAVFCSRSSGKQKLLRFRKVLEPLGWNYFRD